MVDAINIASQLGGRDLPDVAQRKTEVATRQVKSDQAQPVRVSTQASSDTNGAAGVSNAIAKAAEKRLLTLSAGNTADFLQAAEKLINASLPAQAPNTKLRINQDEETGRYIYQGIDTKTGDVITQFPAEEILKFIAYNRGQDGVEGIVVDEKI